MAAELEAGQRLAAARIKALTGEDTISACRKYHDPFTFKPVCKLALATNYKPKIDGTDAAPPRRLRLLPFTVTFSEETRDDGLREKLRAELPGILAGVVRGA